MECIFLRQKCIQDKKKRMEFLKKIQFPFFFGFIMISLIYKMRLFIMSIKTDKSKCFSNVFYENFFTVSSIPRKKNETVIR